MQDNHINTHSLALHIYDYQKYDIILIVRPDLEYATEIWNPYDLIRTVSDLVLVLGPSQSFKTLQINAN